MKKWESINFFFSIFSTENRVYKIWKLFLSPNLPTNQLSDLAQIISPFWPQFLQIQNEAVACMILKVSPALKSCESMISRNLSCRIRRPGINLLLRIHVSFWQSLPECSWWPNFSLFRESWNYEQIACQTLICNILCVLWLDYFLWSSPETKCPIYRTNTWSICIYL